MKRIICFIAILALLFIPVSAMAVVGSATGTFTKLTKDIRIITLAFTGNSGDGTAPDISTDSYTYQGHTYTDLIYGWFLYTVSAWPSGTAPDEAGVCVLDANGLDLLGSVDGGSTAYRGLKLIHASLKMVCQPNNYSLGQTAHTRYFPVIKSALTITTADQGATSANWTVELIFIKATHPWH